MAMLQDLPAGLNFTGGSDSGLGGGGVVTGLILGALLGRGGLGLGGAGAEAVASCRDCVTNESLNQQTLGDIKASIPYAESQVQLALAGSTAQLVANATANTMAIQSGQTAAALAAATNAALVARDIAAVDTNVDRQSTAIQVAIANSERNVLEVINQNRIKDLEQQLTVSQLREAENRAVIREQTNSHNTTVTVNQAQAQAQLQNQEIRFALNSLLTGFGQIARATNSNVVVGSTGVGTSQTANPTNVAA